MTTRLAALWRHLTANGGGQCNGCGQWFPDWNGGTCAACTATGR
jgi:hypothetical protein